MQSVSITALGSTPYSSSFYCSGTKNFEKFLRGRMPRTSDYLGILRCFIMVAFVMIDI
jgi:hypothetical protein